MSILVSIGANDNDIKNLQMTQDIISFVSSLLKAEDHELLFANKNYTQAQVSDLLEWYNDILYILYNGGSSEDYSDLLVPNLED
jgi:hypothetical protein